MNRSTYGNGLIYIYFFKSSWSVSREVQKYARFFRTEIFLVRVVDGSTRGDSVKNTACGLLGAPSGYETVTTGHTADAVPRVNPPIPYLCRVISYG